MKTLSWWVCLIPFAAVVFINLLINGIKALNNHREYKKISKTPVDQTLNPIDFGSIKPKGCDHNWVFQYRTESVGLGSLPFKHYKCKNCGEEMAKPDRS